MESKKLKIPESFSKIELPHCTTDFLYEYGENRRKVYIIEQTTCWCNGKIVRSSSRMVQEEQK
ncbi:MAG: hypothetical protein QXU18_11800 [Thermoplasmatales archaeon]